jgi:hypothetical protein
MNEISRPDVFRLLSANQRLLERLEAENARLGRSVAELMLEIQALREALGHPSPKPDSIGAIGLRAVDGDVFSRLYCTGDSTRR